ncbi:MAG TPA: hypothetical protein VFO79_11430 [Xanthomonadales bacterium]|nr:hypothetical protein [Xanthomonadales bacterium]
MWLEFADGKRWVVDYRPRTPWTWFADQEVVVTGECYEPFGQAIGANHFRVDELRFATPPARGTVPVLALGAARKLRGKLEERGFPAGSKLAGSSERVFVEDGGTTYGIAGVENDAWPDAGKPVRVTVREVTPDMAYMAQTGGPTIWIFATAAHDAEDDPRHAPRIIRCPD